MITIKNRFEIGDIVLSDNNANFRYFVTAIRVISHVRNEVQISYDCRRFEDDGTLSFHIYYFFDSQLSFAPSVVKDTSITQLSLFNL